MILATVLFSAVSLFADETKAGGTGGKTGGGTSAILRIFGNTGVLVGGQTSLIAKVNYGSAKNFVQVDASFSSADPSIAHVSADGLVTGKSCGQTTITASYSSGGGVLTDTVSFTVREETRLDSISISGASTLDVNGKTALTATATFSDGVNETRENVSSGARWSSSNTGVVTVDGTGAVVGKKAGSANVTASFTYNGVTKSATKKITVKRTLQSLSVSGTATVAVGNKVTLTAKAKYADGGSAAVKPTWSSSNTAVATVSAGGVVTGKKGGSATITAKYKENGVAKTATKKITVKQLKSLSVSGAASLYVKDKKTLTAKAKYSNGTTAAVKPTWSSSNTAVATVSAGGVVTGKKAGTVTITAKYKENGVTKTASKKITVSKKLTGITISGSSSVQYGKTITMTCYAKYSDGSKTKVTPTWSLAELQSWPWRLATISSSGVLKYEKLGPNTNSIVIVWASYKGYSISKSVTLTTKGGGSSSGGLAIYGPSTLKYLGSGSYYLYQNGQKVTSASVSWSRSGLCTMSDQGCYGLLKATSKPAGSTNTVTVIAQYNGKRITKSVKITR